MARYSTIKHQKYYEISLIIEYLLIFAIVSLIFTINIGLNDNTTTKANAKSMTNDSLEIATSNSSKILIEVNSERILSGENINKSLPMASTTKVMTALVVIENTKLDNIVTIPKQAVGVEGSSIYLKEGEKLTVDELLYGLMLRSGNDSATALALYVGGTMEGFVKLMNDKVSALNLKNTHFTNPHGLHDDNHFTSAYDLGVISCIAMRNPQFKKIVSTKNVTINGQDCKRPLHNKNKILFTYEGGNGIKTGFTKKAGRCLVASSERNGLEVVSVVLNISDMFEQCAAMMDYAHNNYEYAKILDKAVPIKNIEIKKGKISTIDTYVDRDIFYPIHKNGTDKVTISHEIPDILQAPIKKGELIGKVDINVNNHLIFSEKVYNIDSIEKKGVIDRIKEFFRI